MRSIFLFVNGQTASGAADTTGCCFPSKHTNRFTFTSTFDLFTDSHAEPTQPTKAPVRNTAITAFRFFTKT